MSKADWESIRREYETDGTSARKLGDQYGVSHTTINNKVRDEGWVKGKKAVSTIKVSTDKKSAKKVESKKVEKRKVETGKSSKTTDVRKSIPPSVKSSFESKISDFNPAEFGLSEKQGIFAENVAAGKKLVDAYRVAGYEEEGSTAHVNASRMLRNAKVFRAISFLRDKRQQRLSLTEDEIIHQLSSIANANPNELIQYRRVNCRYCWGELHLYPEKTLTIKRCVSY